MQALKQLISDYWLPIHPKVRRVISVAILSLLVTVIALASVDNQTKVVAASDSPAANQISLAKLLVHVVGEVNDPGVYELPANSRVKDAIIAANGFTKGADQSSLNLAREVTDGEQIVVGDGKSITQTNEDKINLNRSDAQSLEKLPGIGPALAARIIDYRLANGNYQRLEDLRKVAGIGPKLLARIKDQVSF